MYIVQLYVSPVIYDFTNFAISNHCYVIAFLYNVIKWSHIIFMQFFDFIVSSLPNQRRYAFALMLKFGLFIYNNTDYFFPGPLAFCKKAVERVNSEKNILNR